MMLLRAALILVLLAVIAYGVWEVRRWPSLTAQNILTPRQKKLRAWGLFFLLATLGLCLGWTYLPTPHTRRELIRYAQYIILICVTTLPLIPLALLDWRENLRLLAESRKQLFQETLGPLTQKTDPPH